MCGGGRARVRSFPTETASQGQCDRQTYILYAVADLHSKILETPAPDPIFSCSFRQIWPNNKLAPLWEILDPPLVRIVFFQK